ncbi:winged helix-turn-helix domain-containing protein [Amycolatopsis sp. NPDC051071]|uniref:AfsR/SARP family transcriptional regulator n=1 Tax=Amycolatopsis sp. NPDC051071 TaxID=3154637 RepID=UPI003428748E
MTVEFGVLGVLEANSGGVPLELGHARQRSVLAVLLAEANRPVSLGQLAYRVWGDRPPYRAAGTLRSYLSRMRATLPEGSDFGAGRRFPVSIRHGWPLFAKSPNPNATRRASTATTSNCGWAGTPAC